MRSDTAAINVSLITIDPQANQLAALLKKYPFQDALSQSLAQLKTQLENSQISPTNYFKDATVRTALAQLSQENRSLISGLFQIWKDQDHRFSSYEKIFFALSSLTLAASATLAREIDMLWVNGKPKLKATGEALMDYCNPLGLTTVVANICGSLNENTSAVIDMNRKTAIIPTFMGNVADPIHGPVPGTALQEIPSWINPLGWITFFVCSNISSVTQFVGHFFVDSLSIAKQKAQNGFPILSMKYDPLSQAFPPIDLNTTAFLFLIEFCISVKEGGYSTIMNQQNQHYGHFDGFERTGDDFERDAYLFAGVYAGLTALAFLTMSVLLINKAMGKWNNAAPEREKFSIARSVNALMRTVALNDDDTASMATAVDSVARM